MTEQKAVPEIPEDLREMYESSKLDTTMFVGSQIRQLIRRITNLEAEPAGLRATGHTVQMEETADAKAERKKYEALREERDALKAAVERLSAPVSDLELVLTLGNEQTREARRFARVFRGLADKLLASRTTPPAKEPKQ